MAILERTRKTDGVTFYVIDFRDQNGERIRETAGTTRKQAKDLLTRRLGEVRAGTYANKKTAKERAAAAIGPTFSTFAERFLEEYGNERRSTYYADMLSETRPIAAFFGHRFVREIRPADLDAYRIHRAATEYNGRKVSASTVRKDLTALGTIFRMAKRWGVIEMNPALDVEKPREPEPQGRPLSVDEWGKISEQLSPTLRALALFGLATASRLREATDLRWADVDTRGGFVYFTADNKTARSKRVKLGTAAKQVLADMERVRKEVARATSSVPEYVFVYPSGTGLSSARERNRVSQMFRAAAKSAGLPWASFKTLRTTAATWADEEGIPIGETQKLLGHADVRTTQRFYTRSDADRTANVVSAIDRRLGSDVDTPVDTKGQTAPSEHATSA